MARCVVRLVVSLVALGMLNGCASSRPNPQVADQPAPPSTVADSIAHQLHQTTQTWARTPYRLGGSSRSGIDCSAFVAMLYSDVLGRSIPRTTERQVHLGRTVPINELQPGDLVFFRLSPKQRHVGVYLRDGTFAHASVSKGVTTSHLSHSYWRRAYWTARRLLSDFSISPNQALPMEQPNAARSGW